MPANFPGFAYTASDGKRYIKHSQRSNRKPCRRCGKEGLYWSHEVDGKPSSHGWCPEHKQSNWTLTERGGERHVCVSGQNVQAGANYGKTKFGYEGMGPYHYNASDSGLTQTVAEAVGKPVAVPSSPSFEAKGEDNITATIEDIKKELANMDGKDVSDRTFEAFASFMAAIQPKVDKDEILALVNAKLEEFRTTIKTPLRVEVNLNGDVKKISGSSHFMLPTVLNIVAAGLNVMMVGPAGTGKSTIAEQVAEGLDIEFYSISLSPQTPTSALLGYMDANGNYIPTAFRKAYEDGGMFHLDEIDNSHPSILAVLNAGLANGSMAFADAGTNGMVQRHPNFRCVASGNTFGTGPDRKFVGRQVMDFATKDRFEIVEIPVDENLEMTMCESTGASAEDVVDVLCYVRYLRNRAAQHKMALDFSPRRAYGACKLLAGGKLHRCEVVNISIRRGISDIDWAKLSNGAPHFA